MKGYLKKSLALFLTLLMALSTLTCLAMAAGDDESGPTTVTVYITCEKKEIRPGHDDYVDIKYSISPVTNLTSFRFEVSVPDGLEFDHFVDTDRASAETLFGEGEMSYSNRIITARGGEDYGGHAFSCDDVYHLFSARYSIPEDMTEEEVIFGLENGSVGIQGAGSVEVYSETEPISVVYVSTTTLDRMVASAELLLNQKENFSNLSVSNLEKALAEAQNVLDNIDECYQEDVDRATDALTEAMDGLKTPAEEVNAAIEAAENLRESDYTSESWGNLTDALEAAKQIRNDENATNEELNDAADALYDAIDALEALPEDEALAASREALEQAVATVKDLNQDDYPESAWTALQTALENAENVLSDENATKKELDEAYDALALALARANLEKDVDYAKQLSSSGYTADSWEALQTAIANAEEVLDNDDATKAELEDADDALIAALNGLVTTGTTGGSTTYPSGTSSGGTTSGVTSPQTGNSNILLMCMIVLAAGMICCSAVCVSKACGHKE